LDNILSQELQRVIIGGPSRVGKTQLGVMLASQYSSIKWFPLEAKIYRPIKSESEDRRRRALDYCQTPRNIASDKSVAEELQNFLKQPLSSYSFCRSNEKLSDPQIIARVLDQYSDENESGGWMAADIHAEFWFEHLKKMIPNLKIVILFRNPIEAVCASVYWRDFPHRTSLPMSMIIYRSIMWRLSLGLGIQLKKKHPNDVLLVDSRKFLEKDESAIDSIQHFFKTEKLADSSLALPQKLWFSLDSVEESFLTPHGDLQELLSRREIKIIRDITRATSSLLELQTGNVALKLRDRDPLFVFYRALSLISHVSPLSAKKLVDQVVLPSLRLFERLKQ
jgi:hypothetical protein